MPQNNSNSQKGANKTKISFNTWKRKIELLEQAIMELEEKIRASEEMMNEYNSDTEKLNEIYTEKIITEKELDIAYAEWEQLHLLMPQKESN